MKGVAEGSRRLEDCRSDINVDIWSRPICVTAHSLHLTPDMACVRMYRLYVVEFFVAAVRTLGQSGENAGSLWLSTLETREAQSRIDVRKLLWDFRCHGHYLSRLFRRNVEILAVQRLSFNDKDCHRQHTNLFHIVLFPFFPSCTSRNFRRIILRCEHTVRWLRRYNTVS